MKYEIYWSDLTEDAKERLRGAFDENTKNCDWPLTIIEIEGAIE